MEGESFAEVAMEDLSLHILDIVENSVVADADTIEIRITEDIKKDLLSLEIIDNGRGMDEETVEKVLDPFYTTKTVRRFGLGIPLLSESAKAANGRLSITSKKGEIDKLAAKLKDIPIAEIVGEETKGIKAEIDAINKSVTALKERFDIYYNKLKEKDGDLSGLSI